MPPKLLRTLDIKGDSLQMFEDLNDQKERIVIIKLMAPGARKPKYNVTFSTANQNINSVKELTTEGTLFKSLEAYHIIAGSQAASPYKVLLNKPAEAAMQFVSKMELYHLEVGEVPWLDIKYYFRPWYEVSNSPFRNLDTKAINSGTLILVMELDLMDTTLEFYTLNQNGAGKTSYLRTGRYELDLDDIYSSIRKYGRLTATPQSISNTILKLKR